MSNPKNCGRGHAPAVVAAPVLQALADLHHATAPQIAEHIGRFTLAQVQRALSNLRQKGLVLNNGIVRQKGLKGGAAMSTYWLADAEPPEIDVHEPEDLWKPNIRYRPGPRFASVWDYAQGKAANDRREQRAA